MYGKIKEMAQAALDLQNKNFMDETFRKIIAVCDGQVTKFEPHYGHVTYGAVLGEGIGVIGEDGHIVKPYGEAKSCGFPISDAVARQLKESELLASAPSGFSAEEVAGREATFKVAEELTFPDISMPEGDQDSTTVGEQEQRAAAKASEAMQDCAQEMLDNGKIAVDAELVAGEQLSAGDPVVIDGGKAENNAAPAKSNSKKGAAK